MKAEKSINSLGLIQISLYYTPYMAIIIPLTFFGTAKQKSGTQTGTQFTFLTLRATLFSIILMAISGTLVSSIEFSPDSPEEQKINENITVKIDSLSEEEHDVKIFVQDSEGKTISDIWNNRWKSGFYYLSSSYPENKEFTIRVEKEGDWNLCVRMRKPGKNSFDEFCNSLRIISEDSPEVHEIEKDSKEEQEDNEEEKDERNNTFVSSSPNPEEKNELLREQPRTIVEEKISLGINEEERLSEKTPHYRTRQLIPYLIIILLILLLAYYTIKKRDTSL